MSLVYNQNSFAGGMQLSTDDTRLQQDEYKLAFNCRNRTSVLTPVFSSKQDTAAPAGVKQGIYTFGNYIIVFAAGRAFYRYYTSTGWTQIMGFSMNPSVARYWVEAVPVSITNYKRYVTDVTKIGNGINLDAVSAATAGNLPGLLVQDNVTQPQFIFIDSGGAIQCRTTQTYAQWSVDWAAYTVAKDKREYVPIGNVMKYVDGILYIASQDKTKIYRSVSGRPLDFVVNVDVSGQKGGDADSTYYSVGVGGISSFWPMADGSLFVAASNANFIVSKNMTPGAQTVFGEYTFIRKFLFNATCLDDRCMIDSLGDTRFIDLTGIRSFNAVLQLNNEGRNSAFSFTLNDALVGIRQVQGLSAAILYDNDELYAINTIFGPAIAVFDSINGKWSGFDINQTGGALVKQFAKIELDIQRLYCITEDNKIYTLYSETTYDRALVRPPSVCANNVMTTMTTEQNKIKLQVKPEDFRCVLNLNTTNATASLTTFVDNRLTVAEQIKSITYSAPNPVYDGTVDMPDINTQLLPIYWTTPNAAQGWKCFFLVSWTGGASLTQLAVTVKEESVLNPPQMQGVVV